MARSPEAQLAHNTALIADPGHFAGEHGAEVDAAPLAGSDEVRAWVDQGLRELSR